jgi:hypothetical protein
MEPTFLNEHLGEIIVGIVMSLVAWGFRSWSQALKETTTKILTKLEYLTQEFHAHKVDVERRVTRVETKVDIIHQKDIDRIIETRKEHD